MHSARIAYGHNEITVACALINCINASLEKSTHATLIPALQHKCVGLVEQQC